MAETLKISAVAPRFEATWLYHAIGENREPIVMSAQHDVDLDTLVEWCVTKRPAATCTCLRYVLEWD